MAMCSSDARRRRMQAARARGFSLAEMLVVILILGILFVVGGREISQAWRRQKVQSAANDVKILFQRALLEMQRRNMVTFVQVGPLVTAGAVRYLPIYLVGDANGSGTIDAGFANPAPVGGDLLIDEYDVMVVGQTGIKGSTGVAQEFCLSNFDVTQIQSTRWSDNTTPWTNARSLMCDFQGRTLDTIAGSGRQLAGPATLVLTHTGVVNGSLRPATRYVLSVNPVWSVTIRKQITSDDPTNPTAVWVDKLGG